MERGRHLRPARKLLIEMGLPLKTREDAVRACRGTGSVGGNRSRWDEIIRACLNQRHGQSLQSEWSSSGAVAWRHRLHLLKERLRAGRLSEMGVRVMHYEGSQPGDRTDMDEIAFSGPTGYLDGDPGARKWKLKVKSQS